MIEVLKILHNGVKNLKLEMKRLQLNIVGSGRMKRARWTSDYIFTTKKVSKIIT